MKKQILGIIFLSLLLTSCRNGETTEVTTDSEELPEVIEGLRTDTSPEVSTPQE